MFGEIIEKCSFLPFTHSDSMEKCESETGIYLVFILRKILKRQDRLNVCVRGTVSGTCLNSTFSNKLLVDSRCNNYLRKQLFYYSFLGSTRFCAYILMLSLFGSCALAQLQKFHHVAYFPAAGLVLNIKRINSYSCLHLLKLHIHN